MAMFFYVTNKIFLGTTLIVLKVRDNKEKIIGMFSILSFLFFIEGIELM